MKGLFLYDNALDDEGVEVTEIYGGWTWSLQGCHPDALIDGCPHNQWGPLMFSGLMSNWVDVDLGSVQSVNGWGLVNHNYYVAGLDTFVLKGKVLPGDAWASVDSFGHLDLYNHDPCVAAPLSTIASYRYWHFLIWRSNYANLTGGFYLAREVYEFTETPDTPFGEKQHGQIVFDETEGGSERRQVRGEPYYDRTLRWKSVPAAMALEFRKMWLRQHGRSRPFLYVAHDKEQPTAQGYYMPEYVRFARLTIRELEPGETYSVLMTLTGLLRIDH